jgi:hypothetical protein
MRYRVEVAYKVATPVYVEANSKKEAREKAKKLGFDELTAGLYEGGGACIYGNVGAYEVEVEEEEEEENE